MKNTQKKLKEKYFRYLNQEDIDDPMGYLNNFYCGDLKLEHWLTDINTLLSTSVNIEMKSPIPIGIGKTIKCLIEQVEFGYLIFKKLKLKKQAHPLDFYKSKVDLENFKNNNTITLDGKEAYLDTISKFFSYLNLKDWLSTLDILWINLTEREKTIKGFDSIGEDRIVAYQELLKRLAISLYRIYENGEFPEYSANKSLKNKLNDIKKEPSKTIDSISNPEALSPKINIDKNSNTLKTIKNKIKYPFGIESLCDLQNLCLELHQYIEINRKDWNELFQFTEPEIFFSSYSVIKEILDVIAQNINDIYSIYTASNRPDIDDYYKDWVRNKNIQFLSKSELKSPEHYLYLIYTSYDSFDWTINLDELFRVFLTLNKDKIIYDVKLPIHFLLDLQKVIELSYVIAFKDEIEFVNILPLENQEM
ncbi:MAG: hypothetical protein LBE37_16050 [Sphingobacterium sp.]|jgi:hypothetical protein|nr:hypothetical protein [Sphingobacterium sp.]